MKFRPIDETSLRHLFSTGYAQEALRLSYIGPVLNSTGTIETSPDCMILDMRSSPFKPLRCEFKFIPCGKEDFAHNGLFDIAIVWALPSGRSKQQLLGDLLQQNGCAEIVVLEEMKAFRELPPYQLDSLSRVGASHIVKDIAIKRSFPSVFALCMAARLYPDKFHMERMVELLSNRFAEVKKLEPRGRANVVSAFIQTKPSLLVLMHGKCYRWTSEIDSVTAAAELTELITANFGKQTPSTEDVNAVRE